MSAEPDATTILAAINAQFATPCAFDADDSDLATIQSDHIVIFVSRRYVPERTAGGVVPVKGGRVVVRYIGHRSVTNVRTLAQRARAALEDQILSGDLGPFTFESEDSVDEDGDWFVAADTFAY